MASIARYRGACGTVPDGWIRIEIWRECHRHYRRSHLHFHHCHQHVVYYIPTTLRDRETHHSQDISQNRADISLNHRVGSARDVVRMQKGVASPQAPRRLHRGLLLLWVGGRCQLASPLGSPLPHLPLESPIPPKKPPPWNLSGPCHSTSGSPLKRPAKQDLGDSDLETAGQQLLDLL